MTFPPVENIFAPTVDHANPAFWKAMQGLCRIIASVGFDLRVWGLDHIPKTGGALLVSNHQSNLDPAMLTVRTRRPVSFFAKTELFEVPVFGPLIKALSAFPVRRGEGDIAAVKEAIRRLREGRLLTVFPEGTRTRTGEIGTIQPGIAMIIRRAGVPVVPAVVEGSFAAWPPGQKLPSPHPVCVLYGPPMHLHNYDARDIVDVLDQTLRMMQTVLRARMQAMQETGRPAAGH